MDSRRGASGSGKKSKSRRQIQSQPDVYRPQLPPASQPPPYYPQPPTPQYYPQPHPQYYPPTSQQQFYPPTSQQQFFQNTFNQDWTGGFAQYAQMLEDDDVVPETQQDVAAEEDEEDAAAEEEDAAAEEEEEEDDEPAPIVKSFPTRAKPTAWTNDEVEALAKSWVHISEDKAVGDFQKKPQFWKRVLAHFDKLVGGTHRTFHQLNSKWGTLNAQVALFNGYYIQAERLRRSGCADIDVLEIAHADYKKKHPAGFTHVSAWRILKDHPKWREVNSLEETSFEHSDKRRKSSEAGSYHANTPDDATSHLPDLNEDSAPSRQKRKGKKAVSESSATREDFLTYAERKQERLQKIVDIKQRQQEDAAAYLAQQRELLARQTELTNIEIRDRELKIYMEPHDHLTGGRLELMLSLKRDIAKKYGWPVDF